LVRLLFLPIPVLAAQALSILVEPTLAFAEKNLVLWETGRNHCVPHFFQFVFADSRLSHSVLGG